MAKLPDGMNVETVNGYQAITFKMEPNAIKATDAKPAHDGIVTYGLADGEIYCRSILDYIPEGGHGDPVIAPPPSIHYTRHHVDPSGTVRLEWTRDGKQFGLTFRDEEQRKWWIYHYGQEYGNLPEPTRDTPNPESTPISQPALCDLEDRFGIRCAKSLGHAHECRTPFGHRFNVPADAPSPNAVTMGGVTLELPTEADAAARKEAMRDREWEMSRGTSADIATAMPHAPGWVRASQSVRVAWDSLDSRVAASKRERAK